MATPTTFRTHQKSMFFRRIQVILIGVIAVSVLEHSAKRNERLEAARANQRIAKTSQRKAVVKAITPDVKPIVTQASKTQASKPQASGQFSKTSSNHDNN